MDKEKSFLAAKEGLRENLCKYTRQAFCFLPQISKPSILDMGCGSGVPTMELARLSDGQVTGVDINQTLLDRLEKKIKEAGLSERVKTVQCSMTEINFPIESFDIIWAEGSIAIIGFERGLKEWGRLLKPNGFMTSDATGRCIIYAALFLSRKLLSKMMAELRAEEWEPIYLKGLCLFFC